MNTLLILDLLFAGLLLTLSVAVLHSQSLRRSVVLFIVFGLVVAISWARLKAPDVALAEAAIGSGVAGALLLAALRERSADEDGGGPVGRPAWQVLSITYTVIGLGLLAGWAFLEARAGYQGPRLGGLALSELARAGVSNPVTAVLLNYRAYDTLLELAVLLAALLGVVALGPARPAPLPAEPVETHLAAWLTPLLIVMAGYLLWVGAHAPGGAFQAGAMLAAAGIVLRLIGLRRYGLPRGAGLRLVAVGGCGVFLLVGLAALASGVNFLQYPADWAGTLILLIEIFATLSIAVSLTLVYLGGRPGAWMRSQEDNDA